MLAHQFGYDTNVAFYFLFFSPSLCQGADEAGMVMERIRP